MRRYAFFDCVYFRLMICRVMYDIGPSQFGSVCRIMGQKVPTYIIYEINSPPSHQTLILWMNRVSSTACRPPLNPCGGSTGNKDRGPGRMIVKTGSRRKGGLWPPPFLFACFARFARWKMGEVKRMEENYGWVVVKHPCTFFVIGDDRQHDQFPLRYECWKTNGDSTLRLKYGNHRIEKEGLAENRIHSSRPGSNAPRTNSIYFQPALAISFAIIKRSGSNYHLLSKKRVRKASRSQNNR